MTAPQDREFLSYKELTTWTGIPPGTLYHLVFTGELPHYRLGPRHVRFRRDEIIEWLNQRHKPARNPEATSKPQVSRQ